MRRSRLVRIAAFAAALVLGSCAVSPGHPHAEADLRSAMGRYDELVRAMDANGIADTYTEDGELVSSGKTVVRGRKRIREFLTPFDTVLSVLQYENRIDTLRVDGRLGRVYGLYHQKSQLLANHQERVARGRFEADWILQPNGRWRIRRMSTEPIQ